MKKMLIAALLLSGAWQSFAQNYQFYIDYSGYGEYDTLKRRFPDTLVADDFGPRDYVSDQNRWHGGMDFNGAGSDAGDLILAPQAGTIVDVNHVIVPVGKNERAKVRYVVLDAGDHRYCFLHMFDDDNNVPKYFNDSSIFVSFMAGLNNKRFALIVKINGVLYAIGQVDGKVEYKGNLIDVSNTIQKYTPLGPIGKSGGYADAHLHLNTIPDDREYASDEINKNPLEYISYTPPEYDIAIKGRGANGNIKVGYPAGVRTPLMVRPKMQGETANAKRYHKIYDVNRVEFLIQRSGWPAYKQIEGLTSYGEINVGGLIESNLKNHTKGPNNFGSWSRTGIRPYTYGSSSATPHPYDEFFYSDFYASLHKDHLPGQPAKYADIAEDAKYMDGQYSLNTKVISIGNVYQDTGAEHIRIDNKLPVIKKVSVKRNVGINIPAPPGGYSEVYLASTKYSDPDLSVQGDAKMTITKEIAEGCWMGSGPLEISVTASESMKWMKCSMPELNLSNLSGVSVGDSTVWSFITPISYSLSPNVEYHMVFTGNDGNNNDLINMKNYGTLINASTWEAKIPYRISEDSTVRWQPNLSGNLIGNETLHSFQVTSGCNNPPAFSGGKELVQNECPDCKASEGIFITQNKVNNGNGSETLTVVYPASCSQLSIVWKNGKGVTVTFGNNVVLPPGNYCAEITYNICCKVTKCITVGSCGNLFIGPILPVCMTDRLPVKVSIIPSDPHNVVSIDWSEGTDGEINTNISSYGSHSVIVTDNAGCTQNANFELVSSTRITDSIEISTSNICNTDTTLVTLQFPPGISLQEGWSWNSSQKSDEEDDTFIENETSFKVIGSGEYVLKLYSPTGCEYEKSYNVKVIGADIRVVTHRLIYSCFDYPIPFENFGRIKLYSEDSASVDHVELYWEDIIIQSKPDLRTLFYGNEGDLIIKVYWENGCTTILPWRGECCRSLHNFCDFTFSGKILPKTSNGNASIELEVKAANGVMCPPASGFTYSWVGPNGFTSYDRDILNLNPGQYCVTVTDGCWEHSECFTICDFGIDKVKNFGCGNASANLSLVILGGNNVTYSWSDGNFPLYRKNLSDNIYCATFADIAGCTMKVCDTLVNRDVYTSDISTCGGYTPGGILVKVGNPNHDSVSLDLQECEALHLSATPERFDYAFTHMSINKQYTLEVNVGECNFTFGNLRVKNDYAERVFNHTSGDTCFYDEYCDGFKVSTNIVFGNKRLHYWDADKCSIPVYCGDHFLEREEPGYQDMRVYEYKLMIERAAQDGIIDQGYREILLDVANTIDNCKFAKICKADFKAVSFVDPGNAGWFQGLSYDENGCTNVYCSGWGNNYTVCSDLLYYRYEDFSDDCQTVSFNLLQMIRWMDGGYLNTYEKFAGSSLYTYLLNVKNDFDKLKKAACARVTFCRGSFSLIFSDLDWISCNFFDHSPTFGGPIIQPDELTFDLGDSTIILDDLDVIEYYDGCNLQYGDGFNSFALCRNLLYGGPNYISTITDLPPSNGIFNRFFKGPDKGRIVIRNSTNVDSPDWVIWPNPFIDQINITNSLGLEQRFKFELYGMDGKKYVDRKIILGRESVARIDYMFNVLPPGIYLVKISSAEGISYQGKLMKLE